MAANTIISAQTSGSPGLAGNYTVSVSQTLGSETLSSGTSAVQQALKVTIQLDFHAANDTDAGDMANTVSTLLRDEYGVTSFANQSPNYGVTPLYADDAAQRPFLNDQAQVEFRWVVEAVLQANIVVNIPIEFSDLVAVTPVSVQATYPP